MKGIRSIASRATYRRRKEFYVPADTLPFLTDYPSIAATLTTHPVTGATGLFAFAGDTVTATPGTWDDPDGTPTVTGRWVDADNNPVAAEDETELVIPASNPGDFFVWRETAVQAGKTVVHFHEEFVVIPDGIPAPSINQVAHITGDYSPGSTLTKPALVWYPPSGLTITGEWIKNGTPTGTTSGTYAVTSEGDVIIWRETATNGFEQSSTYNSAVFLVGDSPETLADIMVSEVDALIDGKSGGVTQDLWNSYDSTVASSYVTSGNPPLDRNPDFFAPELLRQLTGVAAWKGPWGQYNCYTAITPRHVISCAHGSMTTCPVWFVHPETGEIHKNSVINQVNDYGYWNGVIKPSSAPKLPYVTDLQVGLLATELPEWVMKYPVIQMSAEFLTRMRDYINPPTLYVSQGDATPARFPSMPSVWTLRGQKLCISAVNHSNVTDPERLLFRRYPLVNGDSGCPEFILANGTLHLLRTFTSSNGDGGRIGEHVAYVNGMIARVDASASISTGYTLTLASSPFYGPEPLTAAGGSLVTLAGGEVLTRTI